MQLRLTMRKYSHQLLEKIYTFTDYDTILASYAIIALDTSFDGRFAILGSAGGDILVDNLIRTKFTKPVAK